MKKTLKLFAILAVLLFAASCQNSDIDNSQTIADGSFTVTATIVTPDATRVSYDVDNAATHTITPAWTVGDMIIGFDNDDHTFTFTVSEVDGSGRASLDLGGYSPGAATKLYAIYYPGKTVSNFSGSGTATTLAVDLSTQDGAKLDDHSPVLMCATADINAGSASLDFENQTAIIGVTRFKLPAATTVTSVAVAGLVTTGTFKVEAGALVLTPDTTPTTVSAAGSWTTGEGNICETPLYFATLSTNEADIILNASDGAKDYANLSAIANTNIVAGNYYYMAKNFASAVADVNGVKYVTFGDAWAAANAATSPVTITLLEDCSAAAASVLDDTASGTGDVTLDLNGKTLSTTYQIEVKNGRSLTVTDNSSAVLAEQGSIESVTGYKLHSVKVSASPSSFTLLGGTLKNQSDALDSCYVINAIGASTVTLTSGALESTYRGVLTSAATSTLVMDGDTKITSARHGIYLNGPGTIGGTTRIDATNSCAVVLNGTGADLTLQDNIHFTSGTAINIYQYYGNLNISGGTYENTNNVVYVNGNNTCTTNISGGTFSSTTTGVLVYGKNSSCTIDISGGVFMGTSSSGVISTSTDAVTRVHGGVFFRPIPKAASRDLSDNKYVNILNTDAATKEDCPFTVVAASETPEVAYTARTGNTDTISHGTLQSAAKGLNASTKEQDFHLTSNVNTTSRVTLECAGKVNLYLDDHVITSSVGRAVLVRTNVDIYDGPLGEGGITTTAASPAVLDSTNNTTLSIYGGSIRGSYSYGAVRAYGSSVTLNISGAKTLIENTGTGAALNVGGTDDSTVTANISGGTLKAGDGIALRCGYGLTQVTGGTFISNTTAAATVNNAASLNVSGGYFYTGESAEEIVGNTKGTVAVSGGWFSKAPSASVIATGYMAESNPTTVDGRNYTHHVVDDPLAVKIASVNGVQFASFGDAVDAAVAYSGGDATVTLTLLADVTGLADRLDLTNASGKPIVLDLNAHTLGVVIDSVMTTTGTLTITDGSGTNTGKYTSSKRKQLYLFGSGTITIRNCIIECTRGGYMATGSNYSMIEVVGTGKTDNHGEVNVIDSKVYSTSYLKPFYVQYGTLTFDGAEVTCGTSSVGGYYCVDVFSGGSVTVDDSSFLTFDRKSNGDKYGCIHSRTGNTSVGSSITINSGWFYSGKSLSVHVDHPEYGKVFTINGGYFNNDFTSDFNNDTKPDINSINYGTGLSLQAITPVNNLHGGTEYSYGYQVK